MVSLYSINKYIIFYLAGWKRKYFKLLKENRKLSSNLRATKYYSQKGKTSKENIQEEDILSHLKKSLGSKAYSIIKYQFSDKKTIHWDVNAKEIAPILFYMGPKSYKFLRTIICLPSLTVLNRYIKIKINTGFNNAIFKQLKRKALSMTENEKKCILLIDEISLKENFQYAQKEYQIFGIVDYGNENNLKIEANCALVSFNVRSNK